MSGIFCINTSSSGESTGFFDCSPSKVLNTALIISAIVLMVLGFFAMWGLNDPSATTTLIGGPELEVGLFGSQIGWLGAGLMVGGGFLLAFVPLAIAMVRDRFGHHQHSATETAINH